MKNRRGMSMILALVMCLSMVIPAMASSSVETSNGNQVQPRAELCQDCGIGTISHRVEYGAWDLAGYCSCVDGDPTHTDQVMQRSVTDVYTCTYCGITNKSEREPEVKYVHQY